MSGEKLSADKFEISEFIENLSGHITQLDLTTEYLYNTDETYHSLRTHKLKLVVDTSEKIRTLKGVKINNKVFLNWCKNSSPTN